MNFAIELLKKELTTYKKLRDDDNKLLKKFRDEKHPSVIFLRKQIKSWDLKISELEEAITVLKEFRKINEDD